METENPFLWYLASMAHGLGFAFCVHFFIYQFSFARLIDRWF